MTHFSEEALSALKAAVKSRQNEKRFNHTCGVEVEAAYLGNIYLPEQVDLLRAAAILHDLTKCVPDEEQISLCESFGIILTDEDRRTPQTLHGITAVETIKRDFPAFALPEILRAVKLHTTGSSDMSTFDKIIFLSDYIEAGRTYQNCKNMREKFHAVCETGRVDLLDAAVAEVMKLTIDVLTKENIPIAEGTFDAYYALSGKVL